MNPASWRVFLREPLTQFLLIGLAIFLFVDRWGARTDRYTISVSKPDLDRIVTTYTRQYGEAPDAAQLHRLVDDSIREEIFVREGVALGLDKDDEIVRRRIAQKFEFLQQDLAAPREPTEAQLRDWYAGHQPQYAEPVRLTFKHLYFAMDQRGEAAAKALAAQAQVALAAGRPAPAADPFPGPAVVHLLSEADADRLFGGDGFARAVFALPQGQWAGPFRSGFGWHAVRVTEVQAGHPRPFAEARADILADWKSADRAAQNAAAYHKLFTQYHVTRADRP